MASPPGRWAWFEVLVTPVALSVLMCGLGWQFTHERSGRGGLQAMLLAQVLLLTVVYATLLPKLPRMTRAADLERLKLAFKAAGQRFVLTLLVAGAIAWRWPAQREVFLVWIAVGYVVFTLAETVALVRWMKKTESKACS